MTVAGDRCRPQAALALQLLEEPRQLRGERKRAITAAAAEEPRKDNPQHLLDRTADLPGDLAASGAARAKTLGNPSGTTRLHHQTATN